MANVVRVLFYNTSTESRSANGKVVDLTRAYSSAVGNFISREQQLGEQMVQTALSLLYGDQIVAMDIISAILELRTIEGLATLNGKMVLVRDPDMNQAKQLAGQYSFPSGCVDTQVIFLTSWIDENYRFNVAVLRDSKEDQVLDVAKDKAAHPQSV